MNTRILSALTSMVSLPFALSACGGSSATAEPAQSPESAGVADESAASSEERPQTFDAQVERGGGLYGKYCASCHGDAGQGTDDGPAVVGEGALADFETALDVFEFSNEKMPGDNPGSLPAADMVDILAFALSANGVKLDEPLSGENAASIRLQPE
jgi:ubiquinol-cytochrome c reductase cytochrome c subunit